MILIDSLWSALGLLFWLLVGHAFADFAFQHHTFARGKSRFNEPPGYDPKLHGPKQTSWPYYLTAHALVHAGMVGLITGSTIWAIFEFVAHWIIDFAKTSQWTGIHQDQFLHLLTKVLIVVVSWQIAMGS